MLFHVDDVDDVYLVSSSLSSFPLTTMIRRYC